MPTCPVCGAAHQSCGPTDTQPAVSFYTVTEEESVGQLAEYKVVINGVETVAQLTEAHARRLGGTPVQQRQGDGAETQEKAAATRTKARRSANKSAE